MKSWEIIESICRIASIILMLLFARRQNLTLTIAGAAILIASSILSLRI